MQSNTFEVARPHSPMRSGSALTVYLCGWEDCAPGHSYGPAIRPHYLFHYVYSGKGTFYAGGTRYTLVGGQGFLICPGESTTYTADTEDPWHYCWFGFDGNDVAAILGSCGLSCETPIFTASDKIGLEKKLQSLIDSFTGGPANEYQVIGQMYLVFSAMQGNTARTSARPIPYADAAAEFIENNYSYDIKISDIARHIGIDRTYLYKLFQEKYHISPQNYLILCRLNGAKRLLESSGASITEIALSCGFRDTPSFYKQFTKTYEVTPAQYRRTMHPME